MQFDDTRAPQSRTTFKRRLKTISLDNTSSSRSSRMSRRTALTLTFGLVTCKQQAGLGSGGRREGGRKDEVETKGPGIRRVLLFRRLVQPPRYAISAEARGVYRRRGRARRGRGGGRGGGMARDEGRRPEGSRLEEAWYARAVVWMRGLEFDPESETEIVGTQRNRRLRGRAATEREREESGGARGERGLDGLDSPARRY